MTRNTNTSADEGSSPQSPEPAGGRLERAAVPILLFILIAGAAIRFINIGQQSLSVDEISDLRIARAGIIDILTFGDGFPPLYNLLLHFFVPFGDLAGRVFSALCGVATVGVAWAWARRVAGRRVGTYTAAIVALSPLAIYFSTEGRAYGLMVLLAAGSLWSLWVALDEPSTLRWMRWGLISALGVYTHYFFAIALVAWLIVLIIEMRGRVSREMWLGIATLGALALPALALLPGDMAVQLGYEEAVGVAPSAVAYAGYRLIAGFSLPPPPREVLGLAFIDALKAAWVWIAVLAPVIGLLAWQGYRALHRTDRRRLLAMCISGVMLEGIAIQASGVGFAVRYLPWLLIPFSLWLAAGLAHLRPSWRWVSATALLVVALSSVVNRNLHPHYQVEDTRAAGAYLASSGVLDHPVLVLGPDIVRPIMYYIDRPRSLTLPEQWDSDIGRLGYYAVEGLPLIGIPIVGSGGSGLADALDSVDAHTQPGEPYYLVYTRMAEYDRDGELLSTLDARDALVLVESFAGIDVYRGRGSA